MKGVEKMKKGFEQSQHPGLIPSNYDFIYNVGVVGTTRSQLFQKKWDELPADKRGIIHQPILSVQNGVNDNASSFLWLLNDLGKNNWDNKVPLIIDIWKAEGDTRFNLDHIRQYGIYVSEHFGTVTRPLLRIIKSLWSTWVKSNAVETFRLLNDFDILLVQPGVTKPDGLDQYGLPSWWEYEFGKYAQDVTCIWQNSPVVVVPTPQPEPPVQPEPEPQPTEPVTVSFPKRWNISLFGGLIKGTIEAIEES